MNKKRFTIFSQAALALLAITLAVLFLLTNGLTPAAAQTEGSIPEMKEQSLPNLAPMSDLDYRQMLLEEEQNGDGANLAAIDERYHQSYLAAQPASSQAEPPQSLSTAYVEDLLRQQGYGMPGVSNESTNSLVEAVRAGTEAYKDLAAAEADGHGLFLGCVSGQAGGAMGVHFPNGDLVGDPSLDPARPEVLIYEVKNGKYELVGVEFLVLYEDWHAANASPPVLMGQVFHYSGSPNRYGLPAFYELHVWAWKSNPNGTFADWNPNVSCDGFEPEN